MAKDSNSQSISHRYTCFCFPTIRSDADSFSTWWQTVSQREGKWWTKGVRAIMKFREWSEVAAGPRWKTFIRRFNRTRGGNGGGRFGGGGGGTFNYDPLSYSLNFDEGKGQNGQFDVEDYYGVSRDFSARYAVVPKTGS